MNASIQITPSASSSASPGNAERAQIRLISVGASACEAFGENFFRLVKEPFRLTNRTFSFTEQAAAIMLSTSNADQQDQQERQEHDIEQDLPQIAPEDVEEMYDDDADEGLGADMRMESDNDEGEEDQLVLHDSSLAAFYGSKGHSIFSLRLHPAYPNPPFAVSGGSDDTAFVWHVPDGEIVQQLTPNHSDSVAQVEWSTDGSFVATGGMDGILNVFRRESTGGRETFTHVTSLEGGDEVQFLAWHPRGNVLVAGYADATAWMWQLPSGVLMNVFTGHEDAVTAGSFTPDGKKLLTTSTDGSLILYEPRQATPLSKLAASDTRFYSDGGFTTLAISPDSKLAAVGSVSGQSRVVSLATIDAGGGLIVVSAFEGHKSGESIEGIAFVDLLGRTELATHLITAATDGKAVVWDLQTSKMRVECIHYDVPESPGADKTSEPAAAAADNQGGALTTLVVHGAGPLFTTASSSGTLRTWDARSGALIAIHEGFTDGVLDADVKPDGQGEWSVVGAGDEGVALVFKCRRVGGLEGSKAEIAMVNTNE